MSDCFNCGARYAFASGRKRCLECGACSIYVDYNPFEGPLDVAPEPAQILLPSKPLELFWWHDEKSNRAFFSDGYYVTAETSGQDDETLYETLHQRDLVYERRGLKRKTLEELPADLQAKIATIPPCLYQ